MKKIAKIAAWFRRQYDKLKKSSSLHISTGNWYVRYPDDLTRSIDMTYERAKNLAAVHQGEVKWIDRRKEAREVADIRAAIVQYRERGIDPEAVLEVLERILNQDIPRKNMGICYNAIEHLDEAVRSEGGNFTSPVSLIGFMAYLFKGWEYHNGAHVYPVPHNWDLGCWEGTNGAFRLDLVDHMIRRLDKALDHE